MHLQYYVLFLASVVVVFSGCTGFDEAVGTVEEIACDKIDPSEINEEWNRDHCYKDAALRKNDPSLCEKIKYNPPQTKCYMELAEKLGRARLCHRMNPTDPSAYTQTQCMYQVAVKTKDAGVCDMIGSKSYTPFIGPTHNRENCYKALGLQHQSIQDLHKKDEDKFIYCYDIVYTKLHKSAPPQRHGTTDAGKEKQQIHEDLTNKNYGEAKRGHIPDASQGVSLMDMKDGDVVLFGFDSYPDPENAPHYAVVEDGKLWQIVHWSKDKGFLDKPRDPEYFFNQRTIIHPTTKESKTSPRIYRYYTIYRKK
ncbi:MAG: hypothetical protein U9Q22_06355 [Candidatus Altiarchaeota archaeon]|nr:hypothetical protein [Candidatus Altiarchaeota archaeon]